MAFDDVLDWLDNAKNYVCAAAYKHRKPLIATSAGIGVFIAGGLTGPWLYDAVSDGDIVFPEKSYNVVKLPTEDLFQLGNSDVLCGYDTATDTFREVNSFSQEGVIQFGSSCLQFEPVSFYK